MDYYGVNECASVLLIKERFATNDGDVDDDAPAGTITSILPADE